jgi:O-antigen/teichoic acid export membrane protein
VALGMTMGDGIESVLMRESIKAPDDEADLVVWARRYRYLTGSIATLVIAGLSLIMVREPAQRLTLILVGLSLPLLAPTVLYSVLQRRYLVGRVALLMLMQNAQWLIAVVVLVRLDAPLVAYGIAYALSNLLYSTGTRIAARRVVSYARARLNARAAWDRLRQAVPLSMTAVLSLGYSKIDGVLLYAMHGAASSAGYVAAYRLLDVAQVIPASLASVLFPMFNYALRDRRSAPAVGARWVFLSVLVAAPVVVLGEVLAGPLVGLVFGAKYPDSVFLLRLLLPSFALICPGWALTSMAVATGLARRQLQICAAGLVFNVAANLMLIPAWGAKGCCIATLVTEIVVFTLSWYVLRGMLQRPIRLSWSRWLRLGLVLAVTAAPAVIIPPIPAACLAVLIYLGGLVVARLVTVEDVRAAVAERAAPQSRAT